jgi:hypothetical protein
MGCEPQSTVDTADVGLPTHLHVDKHVPIKSTVATITKDIRTFVVAIVQSLGILSESANFVSLGFCVLDNNIRNFKCVLSCAGLTA